MCIEGMAGETELPYYRSLKSASVAAVAVVLKTLTTQGLLLLKACGLFCVITAVGHFSKELW